MTVFEIILSTGSVASAAAAVAFVSYVVRTSGRDRPHDPAKVQHMVDNAPMHRLDNVLAK